MEPAPCRTSLCNAVTKPIAKSGGCRKRLAVGVQQVGPAHDLLRGNSFCKRRHDRDCHGQADFGRSVRPDAGDHAEMDEVPQSRFRLLDIAFAKRIADRRE